jgi:hypothetical protein
MSQLPYVQPISPQPQFPLGLSLRQFIQTVLVGISNVPGPLVRPRWQPEPPKQPDINVNWIAFGIDSATPDAGAYISSTPENQTATQRNETLQIGISTYGPDALDTYGLIRDGFQIEANRYALFNANMGFVEITAARQVPDLVNQRWIDRVESTIVLRRAIQRTYGVTTIVSAAGTIYVPDITTDYFLDWSVTEES